MGFLTGGPYYDMIGRTGNNVGRRRKGKNVFSMRPAKSSKPATALQLDQQLKFGMMTSWLSKAVDIVDIGFERSAKNGSPYSAAVSYNLLHGVTGVSPNFDINYPLVQFSQGNLKKPSDVVVTSGADQVLTYTWVNVVGTMNSLGTDQIAIVVYNTDKDEFVMLLNAALRSAQEYELQLPLDWGGDEVQSWMLAVRDDGKLVSDTVYVGMSNVVV